MDTSMLTDEACERLLSGCLTDADAALAPVRWFLEDVRAAYVEPVPPAVRSLHPSTTSRPAAVPCASPAGAGRACKPNRAWWFTREVKSRRGSVGSCHRQ
jgi:hypothetical protein